MTTDRKTTIERLLGDAFAPTLLEVTDQSHLHVGHAGSREGKGHFDVKIVSLRFEGLSRLERHRRIYAALGAFMDTDIHALSINAFAPSDTQN